jgi:hypothetical protein
MLIKELQMERCTKLETGSITSKNATLTGIVHIGATQDVSLHKGTD